MSTGAGRDTRRVEREIDLDATPDQVWRALTDADQLTRWFPLAARVTPGVGGSIWYSWRGAWESDGRIVVWEPGRRLVTVTAQPAPFEADGFSHRAAASPPVELSVDFQIEGHAGGTRLRVVHAGFGAGADWDDEVDGVSRGWRVELEGLRHYLARHRGKERQMAFFQLPSRLPPAEAWARLVGPHGFGPLELRDGRYTLPPSAPTPLAGAVLLWTPPQDLLATVDRLDQALFRLQVERDGPRQSCLGVFLSTWGLSPAITRDFEAEARTVLSRALAH